MKRLGLIGFGQFGQLAAGVLRAHYDVLVTDLAPGAAAAAQAAGVAFGSLEDVAVREVVVVAVPVAAMRAVFAALAPHLKPGALVVDVGSVKMLPAQWMAEILPANVDLVATHPLFGPQSAKAGLKGLRFVICPIRGDRHERVAAFGRSLGLTVTVTTAEEHDREMAYVQALTFYLGKALGEMEIPETPLKTATYQHLLDIRRIVTNDSPELFETIQHFNPYAAEVRERVVERLGMIEAGLEVARAKR